MEYHKKKRPSIYEAAFFFLNIKVSFRNKKEKHQCHENMKAKPSSATIFLTQFTSWDLGIKLSTYRINSFNLLLSRK